MNIFVFMCSYLSFCKVLEALLHCIVTAPASRKTAKHLVGLQLRFEAGPFVHMYQNRPLLHFSWSTNKGPQYRRRCCSVGIEPSWVEGKFLARVIYNDAQPKSKM